MRGQLQHARRYIDSWRFQRQHVSECYIRNWGDKVLLPMGYTYSSKIRWQNELPCYINFCKGLESDEERDFENIVTGDESWLVLEMFATQGRSWSGNDLPSRTKQNVQTEKCLILIIWSLCSLCSLLAVPKRKNCHSTLCVKVVRDLQTKLCSGTWRKTLKCRTVHLDNVFAHNSKCSREGLEAI
jgi:hypothetical protein